MSLQRIYLKLLSRCAGDLYVSDHCHCVPVLQGDSKSTFFHLQAWTWLSNARLVVVGEGKGRVVEDMNEACFLICVAALNCVDAPPPPFCHPSTLPLSLSKGQDGVITLL